MSYLWAPKTPKVAQSTYATTRERGEDAVAEGGITARVWQRKTTKKSDKEGASFITT
jgi:hypothetical protein